MDVRALAATARERGWVAAPQPYPRVGPLPLGPPPDPGFEVAGALRALRWKSLWAPPARFDHAWPHADLPSPRDQGEANSCVAHAACASIELRRWRAGLPHLSLAPRHLHHCRLGLSGDNGVRASRVADALRDDGAPLDRGADALLLDPAQCEPPLPAVLEVADWHALDGPMAIKQALAQRGPLVAHMELHAEFWDHYLDGIYLPTGAGSGITHAVCVIGYDDDARFWHCRNSRGPRWGQRGHFRLAYGSCRLGEDLPAYEFELG